MTTTPDPVTIRDATGADAAGCAAIYAPYVRDTAVTFETDPPDDVALAGRIAAAQDRHAWLVAERDGELLGYAYAGTYRPRRAYARTAETSVYLVPEVVGAAARRGRRGALRGSEADPGCRRVDA
ncbi:GNAT family N-acetyltransferase [Serinicoccus marinus]|uniref:GNAT family N-acetyltransferase n=1 Tax=Serinicoccus marinus TaxID=247333 RepID=UPI0003B798B1|nr:GNAT family N-acetyltransferase [Serinicoccus marinus]